MYVVSLRPYDMLQSSSGRQNFFSLTPFSDFEDERISRIIHHHCGWPRSVVQRLLRRDELQADLVTSGFGLRFFLPGQRRNYNRQTGGSIKRDLNQETKQSPVKPSDIDVEDTIYLQIHADVLLWDGVRFTGDVSNKAGVQLHTIEEAKKIIDFEVLYTRTDWRNADIQKRLQQAEKYEILVPTKIPLEMIRNLPNG